jgi:hypothetical protein
MNLGLWLAFWLFALGSVQPSKLLFRENFERGLGKQWEPVKFEGLTKYAIDQETGNRFLKAQSNQSASGLGVKLKNPLSPDSTVSWKWKIDRIPENGSEMDIDTFDHTARVFVAFKTFLGPPRTINYVWANAEKVGSTFHHPKSGRSRWIVLQTGNKKAGQWMSESRNLAADWKRLFGDEDVPEIVGIGVMTDSDGTRTEVTGSYDDIQITQAAPNPAR